MEPLSIYLPIDRRHALARGESLPDQTIGAALFADISGFTPITEALARGLGPQRGAEELTRQLNLVYGALIAEVDRYGGSVIGFSGDAITCWFEGDDGRRAAACALRLHQAMEPVSIVALPAGERMTLALKTAVSTGPARRFLVGDPDVQLIDVLAGATLDRLASAEHHAQKGEVVLSAEAATALAGHAVVAEWRIDRETGDRFAVVSRLTTPVLPQPWPALDASALSEDQVRPWLLRTVYERERGGQEAFLAELRPAVALFVRFGGIDYDDLAAGDKLDTYIRWVQGILTHYEGFLLQLTMGDKGSYLYAAFGAPVAHEDDPARGVAAAQALRSPPAELGFITSVQIGLSRGQMRAGPTGGPTWRTYGVLGDEVNLAARLMQAAAPGQIIVSHRIAESVRHGYRFHALGAVSVKGKQSPVSIYELLDRRTAAWPTHLAGGRDGLRSVMIGRDDERVRLNERLWALAVHGDSSTVVITGEAGIGKSRLVEDMLDEALALDVRGLVGAGDAIEKSTPYYAWRPVFGQLFNLETIPDEARHEDAVPARHAHVLSQLESDLDAMRVAPLLNAVLPIDLPDNDLTAQMSGKVRADNTHALLARLLQRAASAAPLLVILEDALWLDSASWALALTVTQQVHPLLLVLATRPPGESPPEDYDRLANAPGTLHLNLAPLSAGDAVSLACHRLGVGALPDVVSALILEKAEGHPFFSEELAYALRDAGLIVVRDGECLIAPGVDFRAVTVPDTVQGVVTSRIDRLTPLQQLSIKAASVIGRVFAYRLLRDVHPSDQARLELGDHLQTLDRLDLTLLETPEPDLTYLFKHVITQEVAYNLMLFAQRRELHRAVAEWYERAYADDLAAYYPLLAHHWDRAEVPAKAIDYLDRAGEQAMRSGAYREAIGFFNRAVELDDRLTGGSDHVRRARWARQLGEAQMGAGRIVEARGSFLSGLAHLNAPVPASTPGVGLGITAAMGEQFLHRLRPDRYLRRSRAPARDMELSLLYVKLAQIDYLGNRTMLLLYESLRNLNVAEKVGPSPELAGAYASMGLICGFIPIRRLAEQYIRLSQETVERVKRPEETAEINEYIGLYQSGVGRLAEAVATYQPAIDVFERIGHHRLWEDTSTLLAMALFPQGDLDRADRLYEAVYRSAVARGSERAQCNALLGRAETAIVQDRPTQAIDYLESVKVLAKQIGVGTEIWLYGLLARAHWRLHDAASARQAADAALALAAKTNPVNFYAREGYAGFAEVYLAMWESSPHPQPLSHRGRQERGAGQAAPESDALRRSARRAIKALNKFAKVFPLAQPRALLWRGLSLWLDGKPDKARMLWEESLAEAERLALPYDQGLAHFEIGRRLTPDDPARAQHLNRAVERFAQIGAEFDRLRAQAALGSEARSGDLHRTFTGKSL